MKKTKHGDHIQLNNSGIALIQVVVMSALILGTSLVIMNVNKDSSKQLDYHNFKNAENAIKEKIFTFLSDRRNCEKYFKAGVTYSPAGGMVNSSLNLDTIKNGWQNSENLLGGRVDYTLNNFTIESTIYPAPNQKLVRIGAHFDLIANGKGTSGNYFSTDPTKYPIPLNFEFAYDGSSWKFFSCFAKTPQTVISKTSCQFTGGTNNPNSEECTIESNKFNFVSNSIENENVFSFHNAMCEIETVLNKQDQVNNPTLNNNGNGIKTSNCSAPAWNGCTSTQGPNGYTFSQESYIDPGGLQTEVNKMLENGSQPRFLRIVNHLKMAGKSIDTAAGLALPSYGGPGKDKALFGSLAIGSSSAVISLLENLSIADPVTSAVLMVVANAITRCSHTRRVYQNFSCKNGNRELARIDIQKQEFRCKRWHCGCEWADESKITLPTDGRLAKDMMNGPAATPSIMVEDLTASSDTDLINSLNDVKSGIESGFTSTNDLESFYTFITASGENGLADLQSILDISDAGMSSATGTEASTIQGIVDQINQLTKDKEAALWDALKTEVTSISNASGTDAIAALVKDCQTYQTYSSSIRYNPTPSILTDPVKTAIDTKKTELQSSFDAQYNGLLVDQNSAQNNLTTIRNNPASSPAAIDAAQTDYDNITNQTNAAKANLDAITAQNCSI